MKIKQAFQSFLEELKADNCGVEFNETIDDTTFNSFEETFIKDVVLIFRKDKTIFDKERPVFGINLSSIWHEKYWKHIQKCTVFAFMHGDVSSKLKDLIPLLSTAIEEVTGQKSDEVDKILSDDTSSSKITEIFDMIKNSSVLTVLLSFAETLDFTEMYANVDPENITPEIIQNSPEVARVQEKFSVFMKSKIESGEVNPQGFAGEMRQLATKLNEMFGEALNGMVGGRDENTPSQEILGNSPEARRSRMLARMRRKLEENKSKKNSS
jgi:hypothetical protein